jgi:DUF1365 family protein
MLLLDVDDIDAALPLEAWPWLSARRAALLMVRGEDHLPAGSHPNLENPPADLRGRVESVLRSELDEKIPRPDTILLLAQPRSWGFSFNPVKFYFCLNGDQLVYLLAEITNTPWGEKHVYALSTEDGSGAFRFPKTFHVSPFQPMDMENRWQVSIDEKQVRITMNLHREAHEEFTATLNLRTRALSVREMLRGSWRFAFQSLLTLGRIYIQAARLFLNRVPFHAHPKKTVEPSQERANEG